MPSKYPSEYAIISREYYDEVKAKAEAIGYKVVTKFRKGLRSIKLSDVVITKEEK